MGRITKNLLVPLVLFWASQRWAIAQPGSADDDPSRRFAQAQDQASHGLLVEARATLDRILTVARKSDDPPQALDVREKAQKLDDQLRDRLGTLRFEVTGLSAGVVPSIWVDENVDAVLAETPLRVNPGRHIIVAKSASQQVTQTVEAREGSATAVLIGFDASATAQASEPGDPRRPSTSLPPAAYLGLGVGAAGFMVGSVTGILALISKKPNDPRCAANQCPPSSWNDYDPTQRALIRTSTATLVIGAAGVGLALGSILLHKKHEAAAAASSARAIAESVKVTPAPGGMGLSGKF